MQRPADGKEEYRLSNNNLADVVGVIRYIMQEVIPESVEANHSRAARKNDIDAIGLYDMLVKNPVSLLAVQNQQPIPGFGIEGAFDNGVATDPNQLLATVLYGDYVGASLQVSPQIKYHRPWYWYSVGGVCPNLPWQCIPPYPGCSAPIPDVVPANCQAKGCAGKSDEQAEKCPKDPTFTNTSDTDMLRQCCVRYAADNKTEVMGGLCKSNITTPTGLPGCTYQYRNLTQDSYVMLDDVTYINEMPCGSKGDRKCNGWLDWRTNCYDPQGVYKQMFNCPDCHPGGNWTVTVQKTSYCVEYDIHPYCQASAEGCNDPRCMKLFSDGPDPEIGLQFWRGKCNPQRNDERAEAIVNKLFGNHSMGKHLLVNLTLTKNNPPCESSDPGKPNSCTPTPLGGPYCTKSWAGLCSRCYIPGTNPAFPDTRTTPMCPFNITKESGITIKAGTTCKSNKASDLCCLYNIPGVQCANAAGFDPNKASLDEDSYQLIVSQGSTVNMATFAKRWVTEKGGKIVDQDGFMELAYWLWSPHPYMGLNFTSMERTLNHSSAISWPHSGASIPDTIWL